MHAAAALDSFPFRWVLRSGVSSLGCFWCFLRFKVRVWGVSCLIGLGFGGSCVFASCPPLGSVLGHGLGNRAAQLGHGTVGFSCSLIFRPADALLSPRAGGAARLIWLFILWHRTVCYFVFYFLCYACSFVVSLLCVFSSALSPLAGLQVVPPFHFVLVFAFLLAPPPRWRFAGGF